MSMKDIIDMARHRGYFIDQSQSLNLFMNDPDFGKLTSMHFYAWKSGLKTGMYYLRTKSAVNAKQFTLNVQTKNQPEAEEKPMNIELIPVIELNYYNERVKTPNGSYLEFPKEWDNSHKENFLCCQNSSLPAMSGSFPLWQDVQPRGMHRLLHQQQSDRQMIRVYLELEEYVDQERIEICCLDSP